MHFSEIPSRGITVETDDCSMMAEEAGVTVRCCSAVIRLDRQGERVLCQGRMDVTVELVCDRCLAPFELRLETRFRVFLEVADPDYAEREHVCSRSEMDVVFLPEPEVDVPEILRQQMLLVLPLKRLCRPQCRGLCARCGANRNDGDCGCRPESDSPFAILKGLKG